MFAARYFNPRHFAARYFPKIGSTTTITYVRIHRYALAARRRVYVVTE